MSDKSGIEWTDATWNIATGCTRISPGCDHCYIERTPPFRMAHRRFDGEGVGSTTGVITYPERLAIPLRWRRPRRVFVNSLSDLFHGGIGDDLIARTWAVMGASPTHTFQVLTKRPARMRSLLSSDRFAELYDEAVGRLWYEHGLITARQCNDAPELPLPNVWGGVTVENQRWADLRIPILLDTPLAVRWLSYEPALGPVDLVGVLDDGCRACGPAITHDGHCYRTDYGSGVEYDCYHELGVDWVVCGGESGPGFRPIHSSWALSMRDQCVAAGMPFLFKQWGGKTPKSGGRILAGRTWDEYPERAA